MIFFIEVHIILFMLYKICKRYEPLEISISSN